MNFSQIRGSYQIFITIKDRELYEGHKNLLPLILKCTIKKHTGRLQRLWEALLIQNAIYGEDSQLKGLGYNL